MNANIALFGYAGAAIAFVIFTALLLTQWRQRVRGSALTVASLVAAAWAISLAEASLHPTSSGARIYFTEFLHDFVWLFLLSSLLSGAVAVRSNWLVRRGGVAIGLGLLIAGAVLEFAGLKSQFPNAMPQLLILGSIATSLYGLVGLEQLYRNARPRQQNGLKFLCLGLAGIFAYDIFLYSNAIMDGQIRASFWGARGFVAALCVPLMAISVKRIPSWSRGIFASRQIVFYTTTLFAAGVYLTLVGLAGYLIRTLGRDWGDVLQLVFFSAAILGFFALIMSEQLRARIHVWLVKHFFERKYDYRSEWLRLIGTLTRDEDGLPLKKRAIKSLAQIVDSQSGQLWMKNESGDAIEAVAGWNIPFDASSVPIDSPLITILGDKGWVVDVAELAETPSKYQPVSIDNIGDGLREAGFVIPLLHEADVVGFVVLARSSTPKLLNFEDHDLLKTAGQQIASYLVQEKATEQLAESRQFEAYSRFTAFVMHDLKNAIAQQSLVVKNAEKHKRNPEFVDDAIETIKGSVERMRRVLAHLRQGTVDQQLQRVDVTKLLLEVQSHCVDRQPVPDTSISNQPIVVQANRDRLLAALVHTVRNAQDATEADGTVTITTDLAGGHCEIRVCDSGSGMDREFIRDRLFRPFDSTKGAEGMGIGAYQIRETIRACNGEVRVDSELGQGTTMILRLPLAEAGGV